MDTRFHAPPRRDGGKSASGYTLLEIMVAMTMTAIVLVATLSGVVALQKSYAATEEYATGQADQMRLLDFLAQDLRRAVAVSATKTAAAQPAWVMDSDDQGLTINVPNYYHFNASDPQHLFPIVNTPIYDPATSIVTYPDPSNTAITTQAIKYRFDHGSITRTDPWQALVYDPKSAAYVPSGPVTIASSLDSFPIVVADSAQTDNSIVHYSVTFHSIFQPLAASDASNVVVLHNVTFIRANNLAR